MFQPEGSISSKSIHLLYFTGQNLVKRLIKLRVIKLFLFIVFFFNPQFFPSNKDYVLQGVGQGNIMKTENEYIIGTVP